MADNLKFVEFYNITTVLLYHCMLIPTIHWATLSKKRALYKGIQDIQWCISMILGFFGGKPCRD
jgi:hypothetical protein